MPKPRLILRIAVPSPLYRSFDYLPPPDGDPTALAAGMRVRVPFGRTQTIGLLLDVDTDSRIEGERLKAALEVLDEQPVLPTDTLRLLHWASGYYHHPAGEVFSAALPVLLRQGRAARMGKRAKGQGNMESQGQSPDSRPLLNVSQHEAVTAVCGALGGFHAFLLDGVTGSGKTEVYLHIIERVLEQGLQALVLAPEIGLTPQLVARFQRRFGVPLAVLHSGLTDRERLDAWLMARDGQAPIVIGTRSAVFTPLKRPGVIIVDEEHDLSFKQQEGFRYSARDVAVMRAQQANLPVMLGSATPSLESLHNAEAGRYQRLHLPERAGSALHPLIEVLDVRGQPMQDSLSQPLLDLAGRHLADHNQVLLFLNRRGYAPTLLCHDCGWVAECRRCDAHLTLHQGSRLLVCHHCGTQRPIDRHCPKCNGADLRALGHGTERIEQALAQRFPGINMARIDRDTTRRKGALENLLEGIHAGEHQLLIGTQMLTKGHHFPDVTLVGILDADQGLFSADFRGAERMAQLITQVAGRAGRADKPGQVVIQTHHPDHPLLHLLVTQGYHRFAQAALEERREAGLPPYSALALLRAEATGRDLPQAFLTQASEAAEQLDCKGVDLLGPVPAPMEKRAGRYRAHLLLQASRRGDLHRLLDAWVPRLEKLPLARKVRWAVDVDPMEMF
ncbi:MAG: primosomal protein N' [Gammaproteobacteria bacterium]|nr:primosomal protein N' [Gammaproteobacteria bacterium]